MSNKKLLLIVSIFAILAFVSSILFFAFKHNSKNQSRPLLKAVSKQAEPPKQESSAPDASDHLVIQGIGVDAKIISVGLTKEGNMEAPGNIYDVGLYKYGAKLGQNGTAVLAGHLDGANGEKGVFYSLSQLKTGDIIKINRNNSTPLNYKVTKSKVYKSTDKPTEVFKSSSGANLNLITCSGSWDKNKSQYDERLVVFTTLVK